MTIIQEAINDGTLKSYLDFRSGSTFNYANNGVSFNKSGSMVFDKKGIRFASGAYLYSTYTSHQFNSTGSYTWFFVASPRTISGAGDSLAICGTWGSIGWGIYVTGISYPRTFRISDFSSSGSAGYTSTTLINQNVEFVGVITYANGVVHIYVDGIESTAVYGTPNWQSTTTSQFRYSNSTTDYFSGLYSCGGYMSKALTALEVAQLTSEINTNIAFSTKVISHTINKGIIPIAEPNLLGYWQMRPYERRVNDISGNGYTATYNGYMTHSQETTGDALRFSSSNSLALPNVAALSSDLASTGFTIVALVKTEATSSQYLWGYSGGYPVANFNWYLNAATQRQVLIIGNGTTQEYLASTTNAVPFING